MIKQILDLHKKYGSKHFSRFVKKDEKIWNWVISQTPNITVTSNSERIYLAINPKSNVCINGKNKKFKSFNDGYKFCGKAGLCECARQSVSENVSKSKNKKTIKEKQISNQKRINTLVKKYNIDNPGKLPKAVEGRKLFYENAENVEKQVATYKNTMLEKYGVENGFNLPIVDWYRENKNPFKDEINRQKLYNSKKEKKNARHYLEKAYKKISKQIIDNFSVKIVTPISEYLGVSNQAYYDFECINCGYEFSTYLDNGHDPICRICNPTPKKYVSNEELSLRKWVETLGVKVVSNDRTIIKPYEIDIFLPEYNLAIEYCGLFWHSEFKGGKSNLYHLSKMKLINEKNIQLLTVFSDEWLNNSELVKNVIKYKLNKSELKIGARQCTIVKLNKQDEQNFFDKNHLQGYTPSKVCFGLIFNEEIVGAMSFSKIRTRFNRQEVVNGFEILRLAFSCSVPGGASKLLKAFIREFNPSKIYADSDNRWGSGKVYKTIGMQKIERKLTPNYWYVDGYTKRLHRLSYTKASLVKNGFDSTMTEVEIMRSLGYDRIWDCGITRYCFDLE